MNTLIIALAALTIASLVAIVIAVRRSPAHSPRGPRPLPFVVVRDRPPFPDAKLAQIFEGWDAKDERWLAVMDLLDRYATQALSDLSATAGGRETEITQATGAWLAITGLQTQLVQLRGGVPSPPAGRRGKAHKDIALG